MEHTIKVQPTDSWWEDQEIIDPFGLLPTEEELSEPFRQAGPIHPDLVE